MGLASIADGLRDRLKSISGLRVYSLTELPDSINEFPAALILSGELDYNAAFGNDYNIAMRVIVLLSKQDQPSAIKKIIDYIEPSGSKSLKAAVDGDVTLGGVCATSDVIRNLGIGSTSWGGMIYLSTEFEIGVWSS